MSSTRLEGSARERLLAAADELFYEEGVHTVGIDRVIERAGVAKASLYSAFGSKDELVRAYLQRRADVRQRRITQRLASYEDAGARILGVFDLLGELAAEPTFRGCAFVRATAETPRGETKVDAVCSGARGWTRELFTTLAREAGAKDPERLGRQLVLLYDGVSVGAYMDHKPNAATEARAIAELLLDAQVSRRAKSSKAPRAGR